MAGRNGATEEQVVQGRADLFHLINDVGRALRGGTREEPRVDPMAESVMTPELIRTPAVGKAESSIRAAVGDRAPGGWEAVAPCLR